MSSLLGCPWRQSGLCHWFRVWQPNYWWVLADRNTSGLFYNSCTGCQFVSKFSSRWCLWLLKAFTTKTISPCVCLLQILSCHLLAVLWLKISHLAATRAQSVSIVAPTFWNWLPKEIKGSLALEVLGGSVTPFYLLWLLMGCWWQTFWWEGVTWDFLNTVYVLKFGAERPPWATKARWGIHILINQYTWALLVYFAQNYWYPFTIPIAKMSSA